MSFDWPNNKNEIKSFRARLCDGKAEGSFRFRAIFLRRHLQGSGGLRASNDLRLLYYVFRYQFRAAFKGDLLEDPEGDQASSDCGLELLNRTLQIGRAMCHMCSDMVCQFAEYELVRNQKSKMPFQIGSTVWGTIT